MTTTLKTPAAGFRWKALRDGVIFTFMKPSIIKIAGLAAIGTMLVLLPLGVNALLRDDGRISDAAVTEAKDALGRYLLKHPETGARSLAVVDYSKPSFMKRMVVIDLQTGKSRPFRVAHGRNSGELYARAFSNEPESNMSSLGLFRVTRSYYGDHGLSLRLEGLDSLRNGNAGMRDIVLHSADYVSIPWIFWNLFTCNGPRIGRSNGCFVVERDEIGRVAGRLRNGGYIYAWTGRPVKQ